MERDIPERSDGSRKQLLMRGQGQMFAISIKQQVTYSNLHFIHIRRKIGDDDLVGRLSSCGARLCTVRSGRARASDWAVCWATQDLRLGRLTTSSATTGSLASRDNLYTTSQQRVVLRPRTQATRL